MNKQELIKLLTINDNLENSLDVLFEFFDDNVINGNMTELNDLISDVNVILYNLNEVILIGLLTISLPFKNILTNRNELYNNIENKLLNSHSVEEANEMLYGLK